MRISNTVVDTFYRAPTKEQVQELPKATNPQVSVREKNSALRTLNAYVFQGLNKHFQIPIESSAIVSDQILEAVRGLATRDGRIDADKLRQAIGIVFQAMDDILTDFVSQGAIYDDLIEFSNVISNDLNQLLSVTVHSDTQSPGLEEQARIAITSLGGDQIFLSLARVEQNQSFADDELASMLFSTSQRIAIRIHGNPKPEELAAITEIVDQSEALVEEFFLGDVQQVFQRATEASITREQLATVDPKFRAISETSYGEFVRPTVDPLVLSPAPEEDVEPALIPKPLQLQKPMQVGGSEDSEKHDPRSDHGILALLRGLKGILRSVADFVNTVVNRLGLEKTLDDASIKGVEKLGVFSAVMQLVSVDQDSSTAPLLQSLLDGRVIPDVKTVREVV